MHIDFHYYMTRVLAMKAGFGEDEAHTIAYASQFVDDNIRNNKVFIRNIPKLPPNDCVKGDCLDPVCTAHEGEMYLAGVFSVVEERTYLPFHFIPELKKGVTKKNGNTANDMVDDSATKPNGEVARKVVKEAVANLKNAPPSADPQERLIRLRELIGLGIALHSYADTWAHREFSAFNKRAQNKLTNVSALTPDGWTSSPKVRVHSFFVPIGHARAGFLADMSFMEWKYKFKGELVYRNNREDYKNAALAIFNILCDISPNSTRQATWKEILPQVIDAINENPCKKTR